MDYQYTEHTNVQSYSNHSVIPDHVLSNPSRFPIVVGDFAYVRLTRGKWAIIDKSSVIAVESIGIWYANRGPSGEWYALRGDRGSRYTRMHRLVFETTNGPIPSGMEIDHIHGTNINPILLDNRLSNMRLATHRQNTQNTSDQRVGKTSSRYPGVSWYTRVGNWISHIQIQGKVYHLGSYA